MMDEEKYCEGDDDDDEDEGGGGDERGEDNEGKKWNKEGEWGKGAVTDDDGGGKTEED